MTKLPNSRPAKAAEKIRSKASVKPSQRKFIRISPRKQVTIPQSFYEQLGFTDEAECILQDGALVIRPVQDTKDGYFDDQILSDLIREGLGGEELLTAFRARRAKVRPAVRALIAEADEISAGRKKGASLKDVFPEFD